MTNKEDYHRYYKIEKIMKMALKDQDELLEEVQDECVGGCCDDCDCRPCWYTQALDELVKVTLDEIKEVMQGYK